jgi:thioredoxin-like negative regulator of GroEL
MTVQLLKFSAPWCQPCKLMAKTLEQLLPEFPEVQLVEVDVEQAAELARHHNVRTLPTLVLGDYRLVGNVSAGLVRDFLAKATHG